MNHHVMDPCFYCGADDHTDGDCLDMPEAPATSKEKEIGALRAEESRAILREQGYAVPDDFNPEKENRPRPDLPPRRSA
jgi:hypothetical protein